MSLKNDIRTATADIIAPVFKKTFPYRPAAVKPSWLPAAFVYIEAGDPETVGNRYDYTATMTIEIMIAGSGNLDEKIDALEDEMNEILDQNFTLNGTATGLVRGGFAYDPNPDTASLTLALNYLITYED
jgi:hypothetical protein